MASERDVEIAMAAYDKVIGTYLERPDRGSDMYQIAMRAALEAVEASRWRPIAEAPKDGTPVDLWVSGDDDADSIDFYTNRLSRYNPKTRKREGRVTDMVWETRGPNKGWYFVGGLPGMAMTVAATHYRLRPAPPGAADE